MIKRAFFSAVVALTAILAIVLHGVAATEESSYITENRTALSGGDQATVFKTNRTAFAQPITNLDAQRRRVFSFGDRLFNTKWVEAPASVSSLDGLGPLFNRSSCAGCHVRDGRGRAPLPHEDRMLSKLIRLSIPGKDALGGPKPHPVYGGQFQEQGILGVPAEGRTEISWREETGTFVDGESYSLRRPTYKFTNLAYGPLGEDILFSPRVAQAVYGLGLLENIPEAEILKNADPQDKNGDSISGRPNYVWDVEAKQKTIGRFGWKANQPNLKQQIAGAFNGDIGLTTPIFPDTSCSQLQKECQQSSKLGEQPEVSAEFLEKVTIYVSLLAVPARRNVNSATEQLGERIFYQAQCASCHLPKQITGKNSPHSEYNEQTIHPYTDLLLHDLGEDLADNRPDFQANGREWRTPPLWGIGLIKNVNKHTFLLHDGRARNLMEAILWHGGEAQSAKEYVQKLSKQERVALISFLNSL